MESQLTGTHRATYDAVFQHPIARNLHWRDVWSMLITVAGSAQEQSDVLKVTRNAHTLVLHRPNRKRMDDIAELMKVRRFLEESRGASLT